MKYCFGIPTLNRADLLNETLKKYVVDFPARQFIIVDNGTQDLLIHDNFLIVRPGRNLGVAASWNLLARMSFERGFEAVIIMNDDIYWGQKQDKADEFFDTCPDDSFIAAPPCWHTFVLPRKVFEKVGPLDENFYPAYYEDNDYCRRIALAGVPYIRSTFLNCEVFRLSQTISKDSSILRGSRNEDYYVRKWGGGPHQEIYTKPFNQ